jgi:hypothetical protein
MNTTFPEMSVSRLCVLPFSITDFLYNPRCYSDSVLGNMQNLMNLYVKAGQVFLQIMRRFLHEHPYFIVYCIFLAAIIFAIFRTLCTYDLDEALTPLQAEIMHFIHMNASTGCTARMLYEHLEDFEGGPVEIDIVLKQLEVLRQRRFVLPVNATLWIVSGK